MYFAHHFLFFVSHISWYIQLTGSGKSSMLLILMRLVEPFLEESMDMEKYKAPLVIDGLDCIRMGLFDLRSKIGIIPQSPVLFSGTIRSNMVSMFLCYSIIVFVYLHNFDMLSFIGSI